MQEQDLKLIFNAIESGKCLAFLGAGASMTFPKKDGTEVLGLPAGGELARWLAEKCQYTNGSVYDLPKVADYFLYSQSGDRNQLENVIKEKIREVRIPRPIQTAIAQLTPIKIIITSNYDKLLEKELDECRDVIKHTHNPNDSRTGLFAGKFMFGEREVILHKMHGCIDVAGSLVITQSDYIRYLVNLNNDERGMPVYFRKTVLPESTVLFLGYSLEDWNFRVIWEGMLSTFFTLNKDKTAYAVMKSPSPAQVDYWAKRSIKIIDVDLTAFSIKLAEHFKLDIPQLDIKKGVQE